MRNSLKIIGIVAGAIAAASIITRKRADGTSLFDDIADASKGWSDKLQQYGTKLKDRFLPDLKGPNGEDVFSDMYDRKYYMDDMNNRIYTDNI
ncbi:hypothetical protein [Daejeonella oryzae]|uniref:hypothetical protein n=1 Tax=Daejeonella oryzae TaxID=1122943 RepID=UPI000402560A|nr:hypothetical protein [Daejeonella oryzae]